MKNNYITFQDKKMLNNSFIIVNGNKCIIVDPSWNGKNIIEYIKQKNLDIDFVIITHTHYDHTFDLNKILEYKNVNVYCSEHSKDEINFWAKNKDNGLFLSSNIDFESVNFVYVNDSTIIGSFPNLRFILTPGHSESSMCIKIDNLLMTGDHLFVYDIGRTDLPFSNHNKMVNSLKKISDYIKDDNIIIYPGHGESSNWGFVRNNNIYIKKYIGG